MITVWAKDENYKRENFQNYLLNEHLITGIFVSNSSEAEWFYNNNYLRFPDSIHNLGTGETWYYSEHTDLFRKYIGETLSTFDEYDKSKLYWETCHVEENLSRFKHKVIFDEPEIFHLLEAQIKSLSGEFCVSLSSYRNLLFSFAVPKFLQKILKRNRIRIFGFSSQLLVWKEIDKLFPNRQKTVNIHLASNKKHFAELINYAIETGKQITLYAADDMEYDYVAFFDELKNQIKTSRLNKTKVGSWL